MFLAQRFFIKAHPGRKAAATTVPLIDLLQGYDVGAPVRLARLSQLDAVVRVYAFGAKLAPGFLPAAFVAFSRKSVMAIASVLRAAGHTPAVVYGALPPEVRAAEIGRLVSGACDVIVCTDVIGHGVNLPLQSIVVCETRKFDGVDVRNVHVEHFGKFLLQTEAIHVGDVVPKF